jgi:RNA polymerase sigma-70 factor (ECF subfamily)
LPENSPLSLKKNISNLSDEALLEQYHATGETACFGELYNRYIPLLYGVCLKYLQDADKSQDAVMELFADLLPKIGQYEIRVFRTWIYSAIKNHCLQLLRKENREIAVDFSLCIVESDDFLHLLSEDDDSDRISALHRCLELLPEPQRISITGFFMEELSYMDIAGQTGYQLKSVKSYIQNGKRNLKNCIEKQMTE